MVEPGGRWAFSEHPTGNPNASRNIQRGINVMQMQNRPHVYAPLRRACHFAGESFMKFKRRVCRPLVIACSRLSATGDGGVRDLVNKHSGGAAVTCASRRGAIGEFEPIPAGGPR